MPPHGSQSMTPSPSLHLADSTGIPIYSSSSDSSPEEPDPTSPKGLSRLASAYMSAWEAASKFDLGALKRISLVTDGGIALNQSFLEPPSSERETERTKPVEEGIQPAVGVNGTVKALGNGGDEHQSALDGQTAPSLVATVISSSATSTAERKLAERKLETIGAAFHEAWVVGPLRKTDSGSEKSGYGHER